MHKLKEMLMNELYEYEDKARKMPEGKISQTELEYIHKLTDIVKNIDKIEMLEDDGYSEDGAYMGEGRIYGTSYARGRSGNVKRDSMGRYSKDMTRYNDRNRRNMYSFDNSKHEIIDMLDEMLMVADPDTKQKIHRFKKELEKD